MSDHLLLVLRRIIESLAYVRARRHRWTGRFEAHLWDKNSWNESQNKKGKQGQ